MRGKDKKSGLSKIKNRKRIWKNHMEEIMSKEHDWDGMTEDNITKKPIEKAIREELSSKCD